MPWDTSSDEEAVANTRKGILLARPHGCPEAIYHIMVDCWNFEDEERPTPNRVRELLQIIDAEDLKKVFIDMPKNAPPKKPSRPDDEEDATADGRYQPAKATPSMSETKFEVAKAPPKKPSLPPIEKNEYEYDHEPPLKAALASTVSIGSNSSQQATLKAKEIGAPNKQQMTVSLHTVTPPGSSTSSPITIKKLPPATDDRSSTPITELMRADSDPEDHEDEVEAPKQQLISIRAPPKPSLPPQEFDVAPTQLISIRAPPKTAANPDDDDGELYVNDNKQNMPEESGL